MEKNATQRQTAWPGLAVPAPPQSCAGISPKSPKLPLYLHCSRGHVATMQIRALGLTIHTILLLLLLRMEPTGLIFRTPQPRNLFMTPFRPPSPASLASRWPRLLVLSAPCRIDRRFLVSKCFHVASIPIHLLFTLHTFVSLYYL